MAAVVCAVLEQFPKSPQAGNALLRVALPLLAGATLYLATYWLLRGPELHMLAGRQPEPTPG